jgi:hypothetical protein
VSQSSDADFDSVCSDIDITFNPQQLGFIPAHGWTDSRRYFGDLVTDFFRKKSSSNSRFLHKLYNALKIYESDPFYGEFVGVEWLTDTVIKVEKAKFARLLGIKSVDGSLFHQQGNFPSHGFVELSPADARELVPPDALAGVDFDDVRLVTHQSGEFRRGCGSDIEERCRWINGRKKGDQDLKKINIRLSCPVAMRSNGDSAARRGTAFSERRALKISPRGQREMSLTYSERLRPVVNLSFVEN